MHMTPLGRRKNAHPDSSVSLLKPRSIYLLIAQNKSQALCLQAQAHILRGNAQITACKLCLPPEDYLWQLLTEMPALTGREGGISGCETDCTGSVC